jgi:hypothetical protein
LKHAALVPNIRMFGKAVASHRTSPARVFRLCATPYGKFPVNFFQTARKRSDRPFHARFFEFQFSGFIIGVCGLFYKLCLSNAFSFPPRRYDRFLFLTVAVPGGFGLDVNTDTVVAQVVCVCGGFGGILPDLHPALHDILVLQTVLFARFLNIEDYTPKLPLQVRYLYAYIAGFVYKFLGAFVNVRVVNALRFGLVEEIVKRSSKTRWCANVCR